jgi:hypothetical protein
MSYQVDADLVLQQEAQYAGGGRSMVTERLSISRNVILISVLHKGRFSPFNAYPMGFGGQNDLGVPGSQRTVHL